MILLDTETKTLILNATIDYIFSNERFEESPFLVKRSCFLKCNPLIIS